MHQGLAHPKGRWARHKHRQVLLRSMGTRGNPLGQERIPCSRRSPSPLALSLKLRPLSLLRIHRWAGRLAPPSLKATLAAAAAAATEGTRYPRRTSRSDDTRGTRGQRLRPGPPAARRATCGETPSQGACSSTRRVRSRRPRSPREPEHAGGSRSKHTPSPSLAAADREERQEQVRRRTERAPCEALGAAPGPGRGATLSARPEGSCGPVAQR